MPLDFQRCLTDFPYYAESLLKIKNKNSQLVPLALWPPQWKMHLTLEELVKRKRLQRIIVLKARQEGISTYSEGRMFWAAHMNENTECGIIAHEKDSGKAIFNMCRLFYDCLPTYLQPVTQYSSTQQLVFANPDKKTKHANPGLRSFVDVLTAGKKDVARGKRYHHLHCSEISAWTFPEDVIPALIPTIPQNAQSLVVFESTAKGINNFFHKEWLRAKNGTSNFYPFFLAWFDLAEYSHEFNSTKERDLFGESLNDEEKELRAVHSLTLEQLYWRRIRIADLMGDVELFRQEYPSTDLEAFIASGTPIFDRRKLRTIGRKCTEPRFIGYISEHGLVPDEHGEFRIWVMPESNAQYSIGVDVSDGGEDGDFSCVTVWKFLKSPYVAEQVAEWHGRIDPYSLAGVVEKLGRMYNEAMVGIETNAHGLATQQELQRHYWNIYRQEYFDRYDAKLTHKLGWETTLRTKKLLISFMSHCIANMSIVIHGTELVREAMTFIRDDSGAGSAIRGGHDDRLMAAMIGLLVMHQNMDEEIDEDKIKTVADNITIGPNYVDREFAYLLNYGQYDDYEESWMNL